MNGGSYTDHNTIHKSCEFFCLFCFEFGIIFAYYLYNTCVIRDTFKVFDDFKNMK